MVLLEKINELYAYGWTKMEGRWIDPIKGNAYRTIDKAYRVHLRYKELNITDEASNRW